MIVAADPSAVIWSTTVRAMDAVPDEGLDQWTDDELAELALAADPGEHLSADATPLDGSVPVGDGPLPGWYMPAVTRVVSSPTRRFAAVAVVGSFLLINALGLCATYGVISI